MLMEGGGGGETTGDRLHLLLALGVPGGTGAQTLR